VSFRGRLTAVALASLAVGLGALLVVGNVLLGVRTKDETSHVLKARAQAQLAALTVTPHAVRVREVLGDSALDRYAWVFSGKRAVERPTAVSPRLDRAAVQLAQLGRGVERDGPGDIRLRAVPVRSGHAVVGVIVVGSSVTALERLRHEVLVGSLVLAAAVILAAALAIRSALAAALRPIVAMTDAAEDWGAHDLDRRFNLGSPHDELTGLAATLDHLLARIAASRRHEQQFAAEVAHELRTPITALRTRAELALEASDPNQRAALDDVIVQSERLSAAIDTLMAVARSELDPSSGVSDLAAIARQFPDVEVMAPPTPPAAAGDPEIVTRALAPLVENAHRHARSRVTIEIVAAGEVVEVLVRDDGPGLDPSLRERAFEPGVRGSAPSYDGAGLGLSLARRLAQSCGGDVIARDAEGGLFVLQLPRLAQ
jgi:signal transduction histidine kinase